MGLLDKNPESYTVKEIR